MMPGESGLELAGDLRRTSAVPILMLTAMAEPDDRINGLEQGADDYLPKPFEPRELLLRINSILRRVRAPAANGAVTQAPALVRLGAVVFDMERNTLSRDGKPIVTLTREIRIGG